MTESEENRLARAVQRGIEAEKQANLKRGCGCIGVGFLLLVVVLVILALSAEEVPVQQTTNTPSQQSSSPSPSPGQSLSPSSKTQADSATPLPIVARIKDGDTIEVEKADEVLTVRMACIDAPETSQEPFGSQSATRLSQLILVGQAVDLKEKGKDRYGRIVAEVFVDGRSVNLAMVREGQAVAYRDYLSGCDRARYSVFDCRYLWSLHRGVNILIYDCEIINCIPPREGEGERDPSLKYCGGWRDFEGMGISLIGAWSSANGLRIYTAQTFHLFQESVEQADLIVGFNSLEFDDKLCAFNKIRVESHYDLLKETWQAAGLPRDYTPGVTVAGYKLDNLAAANLGRGKSGSGALAPVLWQRKQHWAVIRYLTDDVLLTKRLFDKRNKLIDPVTGRILKLREPEDAI